MRAPSLLACALVLAPAAVAAADDAVPSGEKKHERSFFEVGAGYELHALVVRQDLEGSASNKWVNAVSVHGTYALSPADKLTLRFGAVQRFLADAEETGLRANDAVLTYARTFDLPWALKLEASASVTAPLSFGSALMSLVTAPGVSAKIERSFASWDVGLRAFDTWYVVRYASAVGGNPNPKTSLGGTLEATWTAPFHKAFSAGIDVYSEYYWMYEVTDANDPNITRFGAVRDTQFPTQPVLQYYGGELYARYELPETKGVASDVTLAFAQGDPTLGYGSVLHDGVARVLPFWRLTSQFYVAVNARY